MSKFCFLVFLLILFNYVDLSCYDEKDDDNNVDKDACLKRKVENAQTRKIGDFDYTPDTCCYVEQTVKCDGKKETYKGCEAYDKKNLIKMLDYYEEQAKKEGNKDDDDDDKCESNDPKINCSSYYLSLGFALLLHLF